MQTEGDIVKLLKDMSQIDDWLIDKKKKNDSNKNKDDLK